MNTTYLHSADLVTQLRVLQANHDALKYRYAKQAQRLANVECAGHCLALALECLLLDCKDMAIVSKWWDDAHEAMNAWHALDEQPHISPLGMD